MRVKVGEVKHEWTKETRGGTIWRAYAEWEGYKNQVTSFFFEPKPNSVYDAKVKPRQGKNEGEVLWTVTEGTLVGTPAQSQAGQAQPAAAPPKEDYSPAVRKKAVVLMHEQALTEAFGMLTRYEKPEEPTAIPAARLATSIVMGWKMDAKLYPLACEAAKQMMAREEPVPEPEPEPDYEPMEELPPDDDIPF